MSSGLGWLQPAPAFAPSVEQGIAASCAGGGRGVGEIRAPVEEARAGEAGKVFAMAAGDTPFIQTAEDLAALIAAALEQCLAAGQISVAALFDTSYSPIPGTDHGQRPALGRIPDRLQDLSPVRLWKSPP